MGQESFVPRDYSIEFDPAAFLRQLEEEAAAKKGAQKDTDEDSTAENKQ
ncbi:MAG: cell division protein [Corynebacterium sp.]|nr:cell division protein [Corynebacterium sp.]